MGNEDQYAHVKNDIRTWGMPNILLIGDSHIARLHAYIVADTTPGKFKEIYKESYSICVGGAKWQSCKRWFEGKDLLEHKVHLGDQWSAYHRDGFHPHAVLISMGGNNADDMENMACALHELHKNDPRVNRIIYEAMNQEYKDLLPKIDDFFNDLVKRILVHTLAFCRSFPDHGGLIMGEHLQIGSPNMFSE